MTYNDAIEEAIQLSKMPVTVYVWNNPSHSDQDWHNRYCASYGCDLPDGERVNGYAYNGEYCEYRK